MILRIEKTSDPPTEMKTVMRKSMNSSRIEYWMMSPAPVTAALKIKMSISAIT